MCEKIKMKKVRIAQIARHEYFCFNGAKKF